MDPVRAAYLVGVASDLRKICLETAFKKNPRASHLGGALSSIDILAALYFEVMRYDVTNPLSPDRDRFFISKGHCVLGYYAVLHKLGYLSADELVGYGDNGSILPGHPVINKSKGIEFTNGSLGMGLSVAIGHALAGRLRGLSYCSFVLLGDGECNEGSVWEAAMAAAHFKLENLVAVVDRNGFQQTGTSDDIMSMGNLEDKFSSFGWDVVAVDGHNISELVFAATAPRNGRPRVVVASTIKGKGLSFTEGNNAWHHGVMTQDLYRTGLRELGDVR